MENSSWMKNTHFHGTDWTKCCCTHHACFWILWIKKRSNCWFWRWHSRNLSSHLPWLAVWLLDCCISFVRAFPCYLEWNHWKAMSSNGNHLYNNKRCGMLLLLPYPDSDFTFCVKFVFMVVCTTPLRSSFSSLRLYLVPKDRKDLNTVVEM